MAEEHYKLEEIVTKMRQVEILISQGRNMMDAIRQVGISEVTYHRWRRQFGGFNNEHVKRLKDLEWENARLRKMVSDLTLDRLILQEVRAQLGVSSSVRRSGSSAQNPLTDEGRKHKNNFY